LNQGLLAEPVEPEELLPELEVPLCGMLELLLLFGEVEELPLPVLLLPGELRLPPEPSLLLLPMPPGEVAPPVEDEGEAPKYE
jgi:hypothetical protein